MSAGARKPALATAGEWSVVLGWILDLIALVALAGTLELHPALLAAVAALLAVNRVVRVTLPQGLLFALAVATVGGAASAWLAWRVHPVIAAANGAPLAHALLSYAPPTYAYRGWRFAIGFLELMIASALTPELYLPIAIVAFVVIGAVALSCTFLDQELKERGGTLAGAPLPRGFISNSLGLAFLIFLSAAVIFPVLPRTRGGIDPGLARPVVGYTERVDVSGFKPVEGPAGGGAVLRLYPEQGVELLGEIYLGLLRGRTLDHFDGRNWHASARMSRRPFAESGRRGDGRLTVEVMREALGSEVLPVPYGTRSVWSFEDAENPRLAPQARSGEWFDAGWADRRVQYSFRLTPNDLGYLREDRDTDPPRAPHRAVPAAFGGERLRELAASFAKGAASDTEKVRRVMGYFRAEGFRALLSPVEEDERSRRLVRSRLEPLEEFLFVRKEGHCEWFATAAAVLLRLAGVPTRLVAGFRISRAPVGGVLTVRSGDAHAWVEAWTAEGGWRPVDPTPRIVGPGSALLALRDAYDLFSAYWFRYVVTFGETESLRPAAQAFSSVRGWMGRLPRPGRLEGGAAAIGLLAALAAAIWLVRRIRRRFDPRLGFDGPPALRRERRRMERLLRSRRVPVTSPQVREWRERYERARFGPLGFVPADVLELRASFARVRDELRGGRAGGGPGG